MAKSIETFGGLFAILAIVSHAGSQKVVEPMSSGFEECLQLMAFETPLANGTVLDIKDVEAQVNCMQEILWKNERVKWSDFNITDSDRQLIGSLALSLVSGHHRNKRTVGPGKFPRIFPQTGFRVRREYRRLTDRERFDYHAAVNALKTNGQYETFANIHRGAIFDVAHNGPAFFGWHRVYVALLEEALRRLDRRVSIPYWDSSLDFYMDNPVNSIIWSPPFLGNGDGHVITGPFANWQTPFGLLTRATATGSRLISKEVIRDILSRCRTSEISTPTAEARYNLEFAHNGVHVWVNGHMGAINTAPHDPVFFLHHAFIDYLWELFRIRQAHECGVNPESDYPDKVPQQKPDRAMTGFGKYRNIDGYRSYWTQFWYRYERSPTCSPFSPDCGTPYLRCDVANRRCVSVARRVMTPLAGDAFGGVAVGPPSPEQANRAIMQARRVQFGPRFRGPPSDGRTADTGFRANINAA